MIRKLVKYALILYLIDAAVGVGLGVYWAISAHPIEPAAIAGWSRLFHSLIGG